MIKRFQKICLAALLAWTAAAPAWAAFSSAGTDFWLAMPYNAGNDENPPVQLSLFISSDVTTTATVSIAGLGFTSNVTVYPGAATTVSLPAGAMTLSTNPSSEATENKGIHVTSAAPVTVYGLDQADYITDAYLALPTASLGNEYYAMSYATSSRLSGFSYVGPEFVVVATQDNTQVTITPSYTTAGHTAGVPYNVTLNQGQTYTLFHGSTANADLTGSHILADKPVSVFAGNSCADVPSGASYCDLLVEQMFPVDAWGTQFVTLPLATRLSGDIFRVMASTPGTIVTINGIAQAPLAAGQFLETSLSIASVISSNNPVLVAQYSKGTTSDGVTSDPFHMLVPPYEQFESNYTVSTPTSGFTSHYVNVVVPAAALGAVTLDGSVIPSGLFSAIGSSGFYGAQVPVAVGSHVFDGPLPFGVSAYGYGSADSYGYPGGVLLAPVATVDSLILSPKTSNKLVGTLHCLVADVADTLGDPVEGVRVDFAVTGPNAGAGFAFTDAAGQATFCYTGTAQGQDAVVASLGALSDNATADWFVYSPTITPTFSHSPTFTHSPTATQTFTHSPTATVTSTSTHSPTASPSATPSATPSVTATFTPSATWTPTATYSATPTATATATPTATHTPSSTITPTFTFSPTVTPTATITPTFSASPTPLPFQGEAKIIAVYPNPFADSAKIFFMTRVTTRARLDIYNVAGERIWSQELDANYGGNLVVWNGVNVSGSKVASGSYVVLLFADTNSSEADDHAFLAITR